VAASASPVFRFFRVSLVLKEVEQSHTRATVMFSRVSMRTVINRLAGCRTGGLPSGADHRCILEGEL